ncbi:hypothetical protein SprV_0802495400 [Sparganum proliferum]
MGLFGHMRIHESGIDRSLDTPSTFCTPTMPSSIHSPPPSTPTAISSTTLSTSCTHTMPNPTHTLSPKMSTANSSTTATISETDTGIADSFCSRSHRTFTSHIDLVTFESIIQRLTNQCLEHQHTSDAFASTTFTAPAHSPTAWGY